MDSNRNGQDRHAIVAGNGRFPFLVLEAAREQAIEPVVFAIQEEASPELAGAARAIHWLSLGEIAKLLDLLAAERVNKVLLAGQVKHAQLFSSIQPDAMLRRALGDLERKNTDSLLSALVRMLEQHGVEVVDSTHFLKPLLAGVGTLTRRSPILPSRMTSLMGARSPSTLLVWTLARPSWFRTGLAWRLRPWKAPTPR